MEWCCKDGNMIEIFEIFILCDHSGSKELKESISGIWLLIDLKDLIYKWWEYFYQLNMTIVDRETKVIWSIMTLESQFDPRTYGDEYVGSWPMVDLVLGYIILAQLRIWDNPNSRRWSFDSYVDVWQNFKDEILL